MEHEIVSSDTPHAQTDVTFNRYGNLDFLSAIWIQGQNSGMEILPSKVEKNMAKAAAAEKHSLSARNAGQQTLNTFYDGFGGGRRWGGFGGFGDATTTTETYKVGSLVVDLFDAKSRSLVWRGSSSDTLSNRPDKNTKNLDKGVQKMFAHFPPEEKK